MVEIAKKYRPKRLPDPGLDRSAVCLDQAPLGTLARHPARSTAACDPSGDISVTAYAPSSRSRLANVVETKLPWLFLIYALPSVLALSIIMPPFQVADELAHIERAD